jgi:nucleoside 2-deoxyribosyltransferase
MSVLSCAICETQGVVVDTPYSNTASVHCPVCLRYDVTATASVVLSNVARDQRLLLAGQVRRHYTNTQRPMRVTSATIEAPLIPSLIGVPEKQNALLSDIAARSKHPGATVQLQALDCIVVDAEPGKELTYHLQSLVARDLLQERGRHEMVITAHGWEHIEKLRNPISGNRSDIFVAMSFSDELRSAWEAGIRPGVIAAGYQAKRVDSDAHNDKIDDRIIAGIRSSYATIVDVTTQNAGAYFEAGFALGLGRPVVWTVRQDDISRLHFDTRQFNHLVWTDPADLSTKLTTHLLAVFGRGPISSG